jgi:hypothetical protein
MTIKQREPSKHWARRTLTVLGLALVSALAWAGPALAGPDKYIW